MKKMSGVQKFGLILALIQLIVSGVLLIQLKMMNILPDKWWLVIAGLLAADVVIVALLQLFKFTHWLGKFFCIITLLILGCGLYYLNTTNGVVNQITENKNKVETEEICVVVKKDSSYQTMEDLLGKTCGIQYGNDKDLMKKTARQLKEDYNKEIKVKKYDDYQSLYPALMKGKVDAMVVNGSYLNVIDDISMEENGYVFSEEIRIIGEFTYEEEKKAVEKKVEEDFDITKDGFTVFISGIDTFGDISTKSRSDVNILMTVNPKTHQILLVTTPRDAYTELPGISGSSKDKLTHSGIYGIQCSIDTLEYIYGIDVNYYARVNFTSLINIVDALGGVDVNSAYDFSAGNYHFSKGSNHLNGEEALVFARERYAFADGDFQRGRDQMEVIKGIIKKACSPAILTGFTEILEAVSDKIQTSVETEDLYSLVKLQLEDNQAWEIYSYETSGDVGREYCYSYVGKSLSVTKLHQSSVDKASKLMKKVVEGTKIKEKDVK